MNAPQGTDTRENTRFESTNSDQKASSKNAESARKVQGKHPRGDLRHWQKRVKKDASKHFFVQIAHQGRRHRFTWKETNAEAVAPLALALYRKIVVNGWDAALAAHKPETAKRLRVATVGELVAEVRATAGFRHSTFTAYAQALRQIAAEVANIQDQPKLDASGKPQRDKDGNLILLSRRDHVGEGNAAWLTRVEALALDCLSAEAVQRWRLAYVANAGSAPDARRRAENTTASLIRNARSLFSERAVEFAKAKLVLPDPLPFAGVKLPKKGNTRYQSKIDATALIAAAKKELEGAPFQIFVLAQLCGLRKREIDLLTWDQVDFTNAQIRIERTEWFEPKSEDSIGTVDVDSELVALLRGWKAQAEGPFVIDSATMLRADANEGTYRVESEFKKLYAWLRGKGVSASKPLHELRKELGALLASSQGIFAAQSVLRHAQISTTADYYADRKRTITAGLGKLLTASSEGKVTKGEFSNVQADDRIKKVSRSRRATA